MHVRFIESDCCVSHKEGSGNVPISILDDNEIDKSCVIPPSVPLSQLIMMGKLIPPKKNVITLQLEQFSITSKSWENPVSAVLSVSVGKYINIHTLRINFWFPSARRTIVVRSSM